jgi:DNA-binding NtrC family response regulator
LSADPAERARILLADDQDDIRESLGLVLRAEGYLTQGSASPAETLLLLEGGGFDAVLLDLNFRADTTSGAEGMNLLAAIKNTHPELPVVVLTGWGSIPLALQALRAGAADFLEKPWASLTRPPPGAIIGQSRPMRALFALVAKIAPAEIPVLITGESGTGKGAFARHIASLSPRRDKPFVTLDLGAVPETLVEAELFGHARGAFTDAKADRPGRFEIADGGVLFLDEIGNASLATQARLLSVLEDGRITRVGDARPRRIDVRVIAATNADLGALVAAGRFRQDLLFRLNTMELALPALRRRGDDVLLLADHALQMFTEKHHAPARRFAPEAMAALRAHGWPGNVRELNHVIERAVLLAEGGDIRAGDLRIAPPPDIALESMTLAQAERYLVQRALAETGGDGEAAARRLGLSRSAFYRRLAALRR